jgi:hypothetical protein
MMTMMQRQQENHEQEIERLKNQGKPDEQSEIRGPSTNIRIKQPETYDGCKGSVDLWIFQMQ